MEYDDIVYGVNEGVARITINRPKVLNAMTGDTMKELLRAFQEVERDRSVGVVVLTGAGDRAFCVGGDINWEAKGRDSWMAGVSTIKSVYAAMRSCLKPVIARVSGYAIGGGNHMAYLADFTIAADHSIFGQNGPKVASPAEGWMVSYLVRAVGAKRAREMWMLCRRYTAAQAYEWGLINAVVPLGSLDEEVDRWCSDLLQMSPTVLKVLKRSFDDEWATLRAEQDARNYVAEVNPDFWESGEQAEGASAFLQKRPPQFGEWR
jgi:dihydroxynaphthoic acid synthetase